MRERDRTSDGERQDEGDRTSEDGRAERTGEKGRLIGRGRGIGQNGRKTRKETRYSRDRDMMSEGEIGWVGGRDKTSW